MWPHLRAALILFHLGAVFILAFPAPVGGMDRSTWKVATVQQDFAAWASILHVTQAKLEDTLFDVATVYMNGRGAVVSPLGRYVRWTACEQPWRMFVAPVRNGAKLQVQLHKSGAPDDWETLFEERSEQYTWHELMFRQERLRTQLSRWPWPGYGGSFKEGCVYFARLAFAERPDADRLRCRWWLTPSPTPEQARSGNLLPGTWTEPVVIDRPPQ